MYSFRRLKPGEAGVYREIRLEALREYPEYFGAEYEEQAGLEKLYFERVIEEDSCEGIMGGVFKGENLVGICGMILDGGSPERSGEVVQLYIKKAYQGQGLGKGLLKTVLEAGARLGIRRVVMGAARGNIPALTLYRALGFEEDESSGGGDGNTLYLFREEK